MCDLESQKELIRKNDWKNLIVLDACRYDYFRDIYNKFLKGNLKKVKSKGGCTTEWLSRTFDEYLDAVYFSTNPFVNGKNMCLMDTVGETVKKNEEIDLRWNPTEHFGKVIDVWERVWNQKQGTVLPSVLNKVVLDSNYRNKKKIVHYIQPHTPYLALKECGGKFPNKLRAEGKEIKRNLKAKLLTKTSPLIRPIIRSFDQRREWKIRKIFGMKLGSFQKLAVEGNIKKLKSLYEYNLKVVLKNVSKLSENLSGKTVITADHGEAFGERGDWGHTYNSKNPVLRQIPWFEVKR